MKYFFLALFTLVGGIAGGIISNASITECLACGGYNKQTTPKKSVDASNVVQRVLVTQNEDGTATRTYTLSNLDGSDFKRWGDEANVEAEILGEYGDLTSLGNIFDSDSRWGPHISSAWNNITSANSNTAGSFEIIETTLGTVMLDTRNGQTWQLTKDASGELSWADLEGPKSSSTSSSFPKMIPGFTDGAKDLKKQLKDLRKSLDTSGLKAETLRELEALRGLYDKNATEDQLKKLAEQLKRSGVEAETLRGLLETQTKPEKAKRPALGISVTENADGGLDVTRVNEGSVAQSAGLQLNDIILKADGKTTDSFDDLRDIVASKSVGDSIKLSVKRVTNSASGIVTTLFDINVTFAE